jgi:hypothetical protein
LSSSDSINVAISSIFTDIGIDPYIFAKTYFKTCLRDSIDAKIKNMQQTQPEGNHINVNIYCDLIDKQNRIHDPGCYRQIHQGESDILKSYDNSKDFTFKGNNVQINDESSILGFHSTSLLNNQKNSSMILKFIDYCVKNIIDKTPLNEAEIKKQLDFIKPRYNKLVKRNVLQVPFKDTQLSIVLIQMLQQKLSTKIEELKKNKKIITSQDIKLYEKDRLLYEEKIELYLIS